MAKSDPFHSHDHGPTDKHAKTLHQQEATEAKKHMHDHDHDHSHDHSHDHDHAHDHSHDADAAVATEERQPLTVTLADAGPARKSLTIEVPPERVAKAVGDNFTKLQDDAVIPGFRKGRAPKRLIEKRFGTAVKDEVKSQLISETYEQAIAEQKLEVVGQPDVKDADKIEVPETGSFIYRVEVEVVPSFELPSLEGIEVEKPTMEITDVMVEGELDRLRERYAKLNTVNEGEVVEKDYVEAEARVVAGADAPEPAADAEKKEGEEDPTIAHFPQTYVLVNGEKLQYKGHVVGIVVEELGKRMLGKKVGDHVVISLTGPTGHENDRIKDKPITIHLHLRGIHRPEPADVEAILAQSGLESQDALNAEIRKNLEQQRDQKQREAMHTQVTDHLLEKIDFELPAGLSSRQTGRILQRMAMDLANNGMPESEIEQRIAELRGKSEEEARKQLKLFFILDKASQQLDIDVDEREINGRIAYIAVQQGRRPEKLRQEMMRNGQYDQFYFAVRDQKTLDAIIEKGSKNEVEMTEEELKGQKKVGKKK
jgi:trigger factor